ncbi:hypothetical protein AnigIFM56816_004811 [Aspergillus niger]|nr:hypothetical protein AnigIFM56816_004811 [Aspergillus niger]
MGVENRLSREEGRSTCRRRAERLYPTIRRYKDTKRPKQSDLQNYQQKRIGVEQETANAEDNEALDLHREARREGQWQEVREKKG